MPYIDKEPSWKSAALLILLAVPMYLIIMGFLQIRLTDEALNAAFVQDFIHTRDLTATRLYSRTVPGFPLYSWLTALCSGFSMPGAFLLRLPAFLSLAALALVSGLFAWRHHSAYAGIITAAVLTTSLVSFKIGCLAHAEIVGGLLLSCAWYVLYDAGWHRRKWSSAWFLSLLFVFLATFGIGAKAIILFYFPLFFTGSKVDATVRLQSPQHITAAAVFLLLLGVWRFVAPTQPFLPWNALKILPASESLGSYMGHLCSMFPKIACYLFPWTLLAWAPFCLAMRQFERDNRLCHYLRTIVFSNALLFWVLPNGSPLHLILVFGPMAVLIGVHSEVVFRRCRDLFSLLIRITGWVILSASAGGLLFWTAALKPLGIVLFLNPEGAEFPAWIAPVCMVLCAVAAISIRIMMSVTWNRNSLRSCLLWCIFAGRIACLGIWGLPHAIWDDNARTVHGARLAALQGPPAETVVSRMSRDGTDTLYIYLPSTLDIPKVLVETIALRTHMSLVRELSELPTDRVIYLMSPFPPALNTLEWEALVPPVNLNARSHIRCTNAFSLLPDFLASASNRLLGTSFTVAKADISRHDFRHLIVFNRTETDRMPNAAFSATQIYRGTPKEKHQP